MKYLALLFSMLIFFGCRRESFHSYEWRYSKDSLRNYLSETIYSKPFIEIYEPKNNLFGEYRIILNDSIELKLCNNQITPVNEHSYGCFLALINRDYGGNEAALKRALINKFLLLKKAHISGVLYTFEHKVLKIHTLYWDSSYTELKRKYPTYREVAHEDSLLSQLNKKEFMIGLYIFQKTPSTHEVSQINNCPSFIWKIDSVSYYYRSYCYRYNKHSSLIHFRFNK